MKRLLFLMVLLSVVFAWAGPIWSQNPFTAKPNTRYQAPEPLFKSRLFVKIILWQHQLKQKMSDLIRGAQAGEKFQSLLLLMGISFLYGVVHAAGPGHGKVVAMSYALSHRTSIVGGMLFGCCIALIHGASGTAGVLGLRYVLEKSVSDTLASATTVTRIVSFGLIAILGIVLLLRHGYALFFKGAIKSQVPPEKNVSKRGTPWALALGLVPCPAVVMVMLFCMSMDVTLLGVFLAGCISLGMAATISSVIVVVILGKTSMLNVLSPRIAETVNAWVGLVSGAFVMIFGTIFLLAAINAAFY